jgi:hypothetical protein
VDLLNADEGNEMNYFQILHEILELCDGTGDPYANSDEIIYQIKSKVEIEFECPHCNSAMTHQCECLYCKECGFAKCE